MIHNRTTKLCAQSRSDYPPFPPDQVVRTRDETEQNDESQAVGLEHDSIAFILVWPCLTVVLSMVGHSRALFSTSFSIMPFLIVPLLALDKAIGRAEPTSKPGSEKKIRGEAIPFLSNLTSL